MITNVIDYAASMAWSANNDSNGGPRWLQHVGDVVSVLRRFGIHDPNMLAAAWLHDLIEDYPDWALEHHADMVALPIEVFNLVCAVTDEPGKNRKERKAATYPKIRSTPGATTLKVADRIANVEECMIKSDTRSLELFLMYKKEQRSFENALFSLTPDDRRVVPMWKHLQSLL